MGIALETDVVQSFVAVYMKHKETYLRTFSRYDGNELTFPRSHDAGVRVLPERYKGGCRLYRGLRLAPLGRCHSQHRSESEEMFELISPPKHAFRGTLCRL